MIFLHKNQPTMKDTVKKPIPQINISTVALAVSLLNSFEVTDERIIQGVVTISRRSTKNFVALLGITFSLFMANPTAIIKKIDVIFDKIIFIIKTLYHYSGNLSPINEFISALSLDINHISYIIILHGWFSISKLLVY